MQEDARHVASSFFMLSIDVDTSTIFAPPLLLYHYIFCSIYHIFLVIFFFPQWHF